MSRDCNHDWSEADLLMEGGGMAGPRRVLATYTCNQCNAVKEEIFTLSRRVVDGAEVRL